jgi:hypothetical protein
LRWSWPPPTVRAARERLSTTEILLTAKEGLPDTRALAYAPRVSDDRTYRLIRRKSGATGPEGAIRDAFAAKDNRVTERDLPVVVVPAGTQQMPRYQAPRPPDFVDKRRFGNVDITIEHRGDEIAIARSR